MWLWTTLLDWFSGDEASDASAKRKASDMDENEEASGSEESKKIKIEHDATIEKKTDQEAEDTNLMETTIGIDSHSDAAEIEDNIMTDGSKRSMDEHEPSTRMQTQEIRNAKVEAADANVSSEVEAETNDQVSALETFNNRTTKDKVSVKNQGSEKTKSKTIFNQSDTDSDEEWYETETRDGNNENAVQPLTEKHVNTRKGMKKGEGVKEARPPGKSLMKYSTNHYEIYDWVRDRNFRKPMPTGRSRAAFGSYEGFKLLTGLPPHGQFDVENTPRNGVRLDDYWIGRVGCHFSLIELAKNWPSEFDTCGMVRASNCPLGNSCLIWVEVGVKDIEGKLIERAGAYYGWYRGLQLLCGQDGMDTGMFLKRPSYEIPRCLGLTFKKSFQAPHERSQCSFINELVNGNQTLRAMEDNDYLDEGKILHNERHHCSRGEDAVDDRRKEKHQEHDLESDDEEIRAELEEFRRMRRTLQS